MARLLKTPDISLISSSTSIPSVKCVVEAIFFSACGIFEVLDTLSFYTKLEMLSGILAPVSNFGADRKLSGPCLET